MYIFNLLNIHYFYTINIMYIQYTNNVYFLNIMYIIFILNVHYLIVWSTQYFYIECTLFDSMVHATVWTMVHTIMIAYPLVHRTLKYMFRFSAHLGNSHP